MIFLLDHMRIVVQFSPKAPATKPKSYKAEAFEATFDYETYVNECVENVETIVVDANYKNDEEIFLKRRIVFILMQNKSVRR